MLLIDCGAAAFREADAKFTVEERDGKFLVMEEGQTEHGDKWRIEANANEFRDIIAGRAGVEAVLREMISVRVLTMGMINAGAPIGGAKALAEKLLPAIVDLLAKDAGNG